MKQQSLRAILVDDEPMAREEFKEMLLPHKNVELIGEAASVDEAVELIENETPDIVFLDIEMNGQNGFDLLNKCGADFKTVFVTAYNQYAIRAFEVNAIDYLLKPVNADRLAQTIHKLNEQLILEHKHAEAQPQLSLDDRLLITLNRKMSFIKISEIKYILAAGDYSEIVTIHNERALVQKKMKDWELQLPGKNFQRVHRTSIINLDFVDKIERYGKENAIVFLKGVEKYLDISKNYLAELKAKFKV